MATAPGVRPAAATSASPPSVGGRGNGGRFGSGDGVGEGFTTAFGVQPGWRPTYDDRHGQGYFFFGQYPRKEEPEQHPFTPFVARLAAVFPAIPPVSEVRGGVPVFLADLMRGIGIYDINLKAIAGTLRTQGAVLNRYG